MSEPRLYEHRCFECGKEWRSYQPITRRVVRCAMCRNLVENARARSKRDDGTFAALELRKAKR